MIKFWTWAVSTYARPGVSEALLELQDRCGQSAPYLLWVAWAAANGRPLNGAQLKTGANLAARWEEVAVGPLREVRRALKTPLAGIEPSVRESVRERARTAELAAERALIDALECLVSGPARPPVAPGPSLAAASAAWLSPAPGESLALLQKCWSDGPLPSPEVWSNGGG